MATRQRIDKMFITICIAQNSFIRNQQYPLNDGGNCLNQRKENSKKKNKKWLNKIACHTAASFVVTNSMLAELPNPSNQSKSYIRRTFARRFPSWFFYIIQLLTEFIIYACWYKIESKKNWSYETKTFSRMWIKLRIFTQRIFSPRFFLHPMNHLRMGTRAKRRKKNNCKLKLALLLVGGVAFLAVKYSDALLRTTSLASLIFLSNFFSVILNSSIALSFPLSLLVLYLSSPHYSHASSISCVMYVFHFCWLSCFLYPSLSHFFLMSRFMILQDTANWGM